MAKSIKDLRQERGFRSAREFADALGIAPSSMSRYDRDPESIPLKHAWAMADLLDCSIDEVVGREHVTSGACELQEIHDSLLPETRALMDELVEFVRRRDEEMRRQGRAREDEKYERVCRYYERLFEEEVSADMPFGELAEFESSGQRREAFRLFLREKANERRAPRAASRLERREGQEGPETAAERETMQMKARKEDEGVIGRVMEAYDRLHERSRFVGGSLAIEY